MDITTNSMLINDRLEGVIRLLRALQDRLADEAASANSLTQALGDVITAEGDLRLLATSPIVDASPEIMDAVHVLQLTRAQILATGCIPRFATVPGPTGISSVMSEGLTGRP